MVEGVCLYYVCVQMIGDCEDVGFFVGLDICGEVVWCVVCFCDCFGGCVECEYGQYGFEDFVLCDLV